MSTQEIPKPAEAQVGDESAGSAAAAGEAKSVAEVGRLGELGYLSSAVGHQVINAFSAIVSNAELIRSRAGAGMESAELDAMASAIVEAALDASHVARRLIDRARSATAVQDNRAGSEPQMVDLNRLIAEVVAADRRGADPGIEYLLNLNPIPLIPGNAVQLRLMLSHILQNSREAMPHGTGAVVLSTSTDRQHWVSVTIRDSGSGMGPEVVRHATEPFFTTKPERWGVGLTIAHGIWRRHHGTLAMESHPGLGTTIRLSIGPFPSPSYPETAAAAAVPAAAVAPSAQASAQVGPAQAESAP
jgi:two-component system, NtrC family, sensor kinase